MLRRRVGHRHVFDDDSVLPSGATNTQTACIGHTTMPADLAVYRSVRDFVSK